MIKKKSKRPVRYLLGASLKDRRGGLVLDVVLPGGPAEEAGLKAGDVVLSIGKRSIESLGDFRDAITKTVSVLFQRKHKSRTITLRSVNIYGRSGINILTGLAGAVKVNKKCDSNCDCTINQRNAICKTYYVVQGDGPNGGILLEKNCTFSAMPPGGPPQGGQRNCGTKEYF